MRKDKKGGSNSRKKEPLGCIISLVPIKGVRKGRSSRKSFKLLSSYKKVLARSKETPSKTFPLKKYFINSTLVSLCYCLSHLCIKSIASVFPGVAAEGYQTSRSPAPVSLETHLNGASPLY